MVFGGFGLAFNIISRLAFPHTVISDSNLTSSFSYLNVRHATKAAGKPSVRPLLLLFPFVIPAAIQVAWLSQPEIHHSAIIKSALFVPFLCAWGLQFAHQVGRMILAHVTSTPLPYWDWMWIWSIIGAVDANLPHILNR
jgi:ethanolaminephosphotransferase